LPSNLILGGGGKLLDQGLMRSFLGQFLLENAEHDHRIAGSSDRAVLDRVFQFGHRRRIVPQAGGSGLGHLCRGLL
jgi:hypothetical protein